MHTVVFSPIAGIGVTLFLIVSGYGLNCSFKNQGLKNFWKKKVKRVLIPYFFVIVVLRYFRYDFQPVDFLLDILGLDTTYWFVEFIVYWYIIFYATSRWLKKYRIVAMTVVAVFMFFFLESGLEKNQVFSFVIGVMASVYYERVYSITRRQWIVIGLSAFFLGALLLGVKQLPMIRAYHGELIYNFIIMCHTLMFTVTVFSLYALFPKLSHSRFLLFIGCISYELYLIHFPFYGLVSGNLLYAYLFIAASILAAWLYSKAMKRLLPYI